MDRISSCNSQANVGSQSYSGNNTVAEKSSLDYLNLEDSVSISALGADEGYSAEAEGICPVCFDDEMSEAEDTSGFECLSEAGDIAEAEDAPEFEYLSEADDIAEAEDLPEAGECEEEGELEDVPEEDDSESLNEALQDVDQELEAKQKELEEKQKELEERQQELERLQEEFEKAQAEGDTEKMASLQGQMDDLGTCIDGLNDDIEGLQTGMGDLQTERTRLQQQLDNLNAAAQAQQMAQEASQAQQPANATQQVGCNGTPQAQGNNAMGCCGGGGGACGGGMPIGGGMPASGGTDAANQGRSVNSVGKNYDFSSVSDKDMASYIDSYLEKKGSPAAGSGAGAMMVKYGKENDVDPLVLLAIAGQETQYGTKGIGVNGMLGVGAYDADPRNAVNNEHFSGVENQIKIGAETFAKLRAKGGASSSDDMSAQTAAVNSAGWASDSNWHNGVDALYKSISADAAKQLGAPAKGGVNEMLSAMGSMVGLSEHNSSDASQINSITKESGIDCQTTPWCAAYAMNMLQDYGVLDSSSCSNINYCPTIKNWAQDQGLWEGGKNGYTPAPGDAILFDWGKDGTSDHVGIVEKVADGKVYTIEGNSSDSVRRKTYDLGSGVIMGYVNVRAQG